MNRPKLAMPIIHSLWLDFPFYKQTSLRMGRASGFQNIFSTGFLIPGAAEFPCCPSNDIHLQLQGIL